MLYGYMNQYSGALLEKYENLENVSIVAFLYTIVPCYLEENVINQYIFLKKLTKYVLFR